MSLFPRSFYGSDPSFTPLFRLLDDFDSYTKEVQGTGNERTGGSQQVRALRSFTPKFDVRETENSYELHGELPGIERDNVSIEFTEPQTLVIHGRVERSYSAGTPPSGLLEGSGNKGAIEGNKQSHKVTVEDENADKSGQQQVTKADGKQQQQPPQKPAEKYWVSERSVGEFHRTFSFPTRVDQDNVSANLKDGLLTVVVPKAKKHESKKIAVQ